MQHDQLASENLPESSEALARRIALAQREHDRADRAAAGMFPAVTSLAVEALKAAALVNGGAGAAVLAFIGTGRQPVTASIIWALRAFGSGLMLAAFATALAYLAQYFYFSQAMSSEFEWHPPFVRETIASARAKRLAIWLHRGAALLVFEAFGLAVAGLFLAASGLIVPPIP